MAPLHVVIVGHVDHGKSTLVGRLLHETGSLPDGKIEAVAEMCRKRGMPFEWAFVTDALKAERDQGITIDVSHIRFRTDLRPYVLVDAPGHREFLRNMISGSAASDGALLVIDAAEGVRDQSRRHAFLLHLLGLSQVAVVVNKMDLAEDQEARFAAIEREFRAYLAGIGIAPLAVIPASARTGANIAARDPAMPWYSGPTVAEALDRMAVAAPPREQPLRLPIQDVYKFDARRILAGRIESGRLHVGDTLLFSPSNKTARVKTLESWNAPAPLLRAAAGQSVGITLDEQIFVERGDIASHLEAPPVETNVFRARLFWLGREPLAEGRQYTLKLGTTVTPVTVERVERVIDTADLSTRAGGAIARDEVGEVVLRARALVALDPFAANKRTGRFVLVDGYDLVGGGIVSMDGYADQRALVTVKSTNVEAVAHRVTAEMRAARAGHAGGVLWFTGLSGAGKSTLAIELEQRLFAKGYQVYVLDGDNVRRGLNANLGFTPEDRAENIRRVGEVAALFADAGVIVISALISPYRSDRDRAREAAGKRFHEVYIKAGLAACETRDPKGLYKRARAGEIRDFTGVSAPYEPPSAPELVVDTEALSVDDAIARLVDYVESHFALKRA
ncbi:MAG TPA: adenylyl-sulfate kinase [Alphaproteobacteria bacterium]|nr:adenylyl-sulfate kinase [Alphaproteobacteria bacterium]